MGTIKINKNNNETNKDKTKLELFIEKQSALQNNGAAVQTAKEAEPTALSAATAVATKGLSNANQIIVSNEEIIKCASVYSAEDVSDTYEGMLKVDWYSPGSGEYWAEINLNVDKLHLDSKINSVMFISLCLALTIEHGIEKLLLKISTYVLLKFDFSKSKTALYCLQVVTVEITAHNNVARKTIENFPLAIKQAISPVAEKTK